MFKRQRAPKIVTVIGQDTALAGDLTFRGGIHVDGSVRGNVSSPNDAYGVLVLSETGVIEGDIRVVDVVLNGRVVGDVHVSGRAELAPHARITGTVHYHLLEMAKGAEVNGRLMHLEADDESPICGKSEGSEAGASDQPAPAETGPVIE